MLAVVTSEEWYKRDLPHKAFLWYLTAAHQPGECGIRLVSVKGLNKRGKKTKEKENQTTDKKNTP